MTYIFLCYHGFNFINFKFKLSTATAQYPFQALGQIPYSTRNFQHWQQKLVDCYLAQENSSDAWPPLKIVQFVQLALIKQSKHSRHIDLQTVQNDIDAVYGQKTSVEFDKLFRDTDHGALLLFEGRPGSGKTTLMVKVSCDWAKNKLWHNKLVVFVRLRHVRKSTKLGDLLESSCSTLTLEEVHSLTCYIEGWHGENVVFVLDGYDEYSPGDNNYILDIILKKRFSRSVVVLSSRPAATQSFRVKTTTWIEVVGFKKEQVTKYVDTYFEGNSKRAKELNEHLERHPNLLNMCYLPLHCAMIAFLYEDEKFLPETETEFYKHFTLSTLIRSIRKLDESPENLFELSSYDILPYKEKDLFKTICELAFHATVNSQQVFKLSDLHEIFKDKTSVNNIGLVVIDRYFVRYGLTETYSFIHLTFQEHLAAVYLAKLDESKLLSTIAQSCGQSVAFHSSRRQTSFLPTLAPHHGQHHFGQPNLKLSTEIGVEHHGIANAKKLNVVFKFLFGMIDFSKSSTMDILKLILDSNYDDVLYCVSCAFEAQHPSPCNYLFRNNTLYISQSHKRQTSVLDVNKLDMVHIVYVIDNAGKQAPKVHFDNCNFDCEAAIVLLRGIGDHEISLKIE